MARIAGAPVLDLGRLRNVPYVWPEESPDPLWLDTQLSPAEVRAAFLRRRRTLARSQRELEMWEAANAVADALLIRWLTPAQKDQFDRAGGFMVQTSCRKYWLQPDPHFDWHYVVALAGQPLAVTQRYCIALRPEAPSADNLLAIKLLLEGDEEKFLRIAHPYVGPDVLGGPHAAHLR